MIINDFDKNNTSGQIYSSINKKRYGGKFKLSKDESIECYTKKQIKALYPKNDYNIVAEFVSGNNDSSAGLLIHKDKRLKLSKYKKHNRAIFSEKGFINIAEDSYIALLKNTLGVKAIAAVACIALILCGTLLALNLGKGEELTSISDDKVAAGADVKETELELEENAVDWEGVKTENTGGITAGIAIPGYKNITISAGTKDVKINLQNPEGNPCYFVISLILSDGTVIYKSKMIEPGKGLYEIELLESLEKGDYDATVKYETFSLDGLTPLNGAEVKITLIAQ